MSDTQKRTRRQRRERGAVATLFAVLLAGGVVMGMLALSVDVGSIMLERRQLQNGADATSLALAQACAKNSADCADSAAEKANLVGLAGLNAGRDGLAQLRSRADAPNGMCGRGVSTLPNCNSATSNAPITKLVECPPVPSWLTTGNGASVPYVETYTLTKSKQANDTVLPKYFSQALTGGGADTSVSACARAAWGPAGNTGVTLPLVMGYCDWNNKTNNGTKYAPPPPYTPAPGNSSTALPSTITGGGYPIAIVAHAGSDNGVDTCGRADNGLFYPGGFGWLDTDPGKCTASIDATATVGGAPGSSLPSVCKTALQDYVGTQVFIPVMVSASGTGSNATYKIQGIASFYLAGFDQMASASPSKTYSKYSEPAGLCTGKCNGSTTYIWGWFTSGLLPVGTSISTGPARGANVVTPAG